jgi:hypothetical protein
MIKGKAVTPPEWIDPDDAPELTDAWFDAAEHRVGGLEQPARAITVDSVILIEGKGSIFGALSGVNRRILR